MATLSYEELVDTPEIAHSVEQGGEDVINDSSYTRPKGLKTWKIEREGRVLKLVYSPLKGARFIDKETACGGTCELAMRVFCIKREDVLDVDKSDVTSRTIVLGRVEDEMPGYYRILARILGLEHDIYIDIDAEVEIWWFFPVKINARLSIFQKLDRLIGEDVYIGGAAENAIPIDYWMWLLFNIPGRVEIDHYVEARMQELFSEYLPTIKDGEGALKKLLAKWPKGGLKKRRQVGFELVAAYDKENWVAD